MLMLCDLLVVGLPARGFTPRSRFFPSRGPTLRFYWLIRKPIPAHRFFFLLWPLAMISFDNPSARGLPKFPFSILRAAEPAEVEARSF